MDLLLAAGGVLILWLIGWFAFRVGGDAAARKYQGELASARAATRRTQRDLEATREELALLRRHMRTGTPPTNVLRFPADPS